MKTIASTILVLFAAGCATVGPPKELQNARAADTRASKGLTASLNPADLHSAKQSLAGAESVFAEDGDTQKTRDLAYAADISFQIAESRARTAQASNERNQTNAQMNANIAASGQRATAQLGQANQLLASQGQALQNRDQALQTQGAALKNEQQLRIEAEKRAV